MRLCGSESVRVKQLPLGAARCVIYSLTLILIYCIFEFRGLLVKSISFVLMSELTSSLSQYLENTR